MEERIVTLHPDPQKSGVRIELAKYEQVRGAILESLQSKGALSFTQLSEDVECQIGENFEGSLPWYVVTVKLDLEARQVIERLSGKPHQVRIKVLGNAGDPL